MGETGERAVTLDDLQFDVGARRTAVEILEGTLSRTRSALDAAEHRLHAAEWASRQERQLVDYEYLRKAALADPLRFDEASVLFNSGDPAGATITVIKHSEQHGRALTATMELPFQVLDNPNRCVVADLIASLLARDWQIAEMRGPQV